MANNIVEEITFEMMLVEWHPTKNKSAVPSQKNALKTRTKAWWQCSLGHEWEAVVEYRLKKRAPCRVCAHRQLLVGFNDLVTTHPELAAEWHPTKNGDLKPYDVLASYGEKVWWLNKACGHEWDANLRNRSGLGAKCPICSGTRILPGYNDLASNNPTLAAEWHPTKNGDFTPEQVSAGSHKKVWWLGNDCGHSWIAMIAKRNDNIGACTECHAINRVANSIAIVYPELAKEWHPTKNGTLTPDQVTKASDKVVWWLGKDCGHEWDTVANWRTTSDQKCPICSGKRILVGFNDVASLHPELAKEWHPTKNGTLKPEQLTVGSHTSVWWLAGCGHEWQSVVKDRISRDTQCPYCTQKKVLTGFNDLATTKPQLLAEWHPTKNGDLLPSQIHAGANKQVWWQCSQGHEFSTQLSSKEVGSCRACVGSVGERAIADFLESASLAVVRADRKLLQGMELDIYIPSHKIAIEYNGIYWHSELQGKDRNYHHAKYLACKNLGIQLIQIWEDEWKKNPERIKTMLLHKLGITQQEKVFARKTIITQLKKAEIESFLEKHHVQGYAAGSYYLGLREKVAANDLNKDKSDAELLAVLILKKEANNTLNIIRYATSKNVVGGFTKLLTYAETNYKPARFITFSDHCVSDGGLYEKNGFAADKELPPDYRYVVNDERKHKFGYRLKRFRDDPNLKWEEGLTERELAALNNIPRIWDAGKTRWVYVCSSKI